MNRRIKRSILCIVTALVMMLSSACGAAASGAAQSTTAAAQESTAAVQESTAAAETPAAGNEAAETTAGETPAAEPAAETEAAAEDTAAAAETEEVFAQWNEDAPALHTLIEYVEKVTEEGSESFIPAEDRIAVFDMDGTLMGELVSDLSGVLHACLADPEGSLL